MNNYRKIVVADNEEGEENIRVTIVDACRIRM